MNAKDAIRYLLVSNQNITKQFVSDLSDADMTARAAPGANHIAWQLGHLIAAEGTYFPAKMSGAATIPLPAGFEKQHGKETANLEPPTGFLTKAEYLDLYDKVRANTLATLDKLEDADLDKPTGMPMADTIGKLLLLIGNHDMMHAGQYTVLRRKLGKPVLF